MSGITIPLFHGEADFDRLPVHILQCGPDTPPRLRIYAQGQICRTEEEILVRLWTFEGAPPDDVRLIADLRHGGHVLTLSADIAGNVRMLADGREIDGASATTFSGEDLQGVYRGVVMHLPIKIFADVTATDFSSQDTISIGCNLLRAGESVSSLAPQGEYVTAEIAQNPKGAF